MCSLLLSGELTAYGAFDTAVLVISRMGPAAQVGIGANGKNLNNGLSNWLNWKWQNGKRPSKVGKCQPKLNQTSHGDINIDISPPSCPPLGTHALVSTAVTAHGLLISRVAAAAALL